MNFHTSIEPFDQEFVTPAQIEVIHNLCATGQPVTVKWVDVNFNGKLVQYVTLRDANNPVTRLFLHLENSQEIKTFTWHHIDRISWVGELPRDADTTVSAIKRLVATALKHPQPVDATTKLVNTLREKGITHEDLYKTVDYSCRIVLQCRFISELIKRGDLNEARNQYQKIVSMNAMPSFSWTSYDFSFAILSLIKADIITEELYAEVQATNRADHQEDEFRHKELAKDNLQTRVAFAIRETQNPILQHLFNEGGISHEDILKIQALRLDPKVQQLRRMLNIQESGQVV